MLEHKYRFHGHGSLRRLHQNGDIVRHRSMSLKYHPNPTRVHSRATVIVAKKVSKSAVVRNRIRRRVYEIVRAHWDEIAAPYDFVFMIFDAQMAIAPYEDVERDMLQVLAEAGLIKVRANQ